MGRRKSSNSKAKRKKRKIKTETLAPQQSGMKEKNVDDDGGKRRFHACYLLTSLSPLSRSTTYIGFTVNPRRRIRQHNGEITSGACKTKKRRPWEMVLCIYGFPTHVSALQFEWAWQHPRESKAVRQEVASFKSFTGIANKIKLAYTMLSLPPWQSLNVTVNYLSTKHMSCSSGLPCLPEQMKVRVCSIDELPCYTETADSIHGDGEDEEQHGSYNDNGHQIISDLKGNTEGEDGKGKGLLSGEDDNRSEDTSSTGHNTDYSSICNETSEKHGWFEVGHMMNAFNFNHSPPRRTSPIHNEPSVRETGDRNMLVLIDGSGPRLDSIKRKEEPTNVPHQVDVIDLLSPECRMLSVCKKGRFSAAVSPKIIDLT